MNNNENNKIDHGFKLVDKEECPVEIESRHWRAQAIYLNDISLVVDLTTCKNNGEPEDLKEDLYSLLMSINQAALEHNLMRPVVGVISGTDLHDYKLEIQRWDSDQDWHRGAFTLFVEQNDDEVKKRINDLRELKVEKFQPHQAETESKSVKDFAFSKSQPNELKGIAAELETIIQRIDRPGKYDILELLHSISSKIMVGADRIAKGGE